MLQGHGDDIFQYPDIRMNFSSNIFAHADMSELKAHLCRNIHLIDNYPEPSPHSLEQLIASKAGVSPDSVLVTNGATEAIYLIAQALVSIQSLQASVPPSQASVSSFQASVPSSQASVSSSQALVSSSQASVPSSQASVSSVQVESAPPHIAPCTHFCTGPQPTFSEYADASLLQGLKEEKWSPVTPPIEPIMPIMPIKPIMPIPPKKPIPKNNPPTLLWLCNPNNPTGSIYAPSEISDLARRYAYVVVDQSYEDLTLAPMMTPCEAAASQNIIQIHSLTKTYAIPGLRIGYVVASPTVVGMLRRYVRPWSVNALAIEAGRWLLNHDLKAVPDLPAYLEETQRLRQQLNLIPGIETAPTYTNFILARVATTTAACLKDALARHHHILIRDASNFSGLTPHHFRVSAQASEENNFLVRAIRATMKA